MVNLVDRPGDGFDDGVAGRCKAAGRTTVLAATGATALRVGLGVDRADRDPARAALLPARSIFGRRRWFGAAGWWRSSFPRLLAIASFTVAALEPGSRRLARSAES